MFQNLYKTSVAFAFAEVANIIHLQTIFVHLDLAFEILHSLKFSLKINVKTL